MTISPAAQRAGLRWLKLFTALAMVVSQLAILGPRAASAGTPIPSNFFTVIDSGGVNDINSEQNDLTQMGRDDTDASRYKLFWSWDTTNYTAQKGNACALFDTDGDGNINYAVCAEIENVPSGNTSVVEQTSISPVAVSCSDSKPDRCTQPSAPIPFTTTDVKSGDLFNFNPSPPANLLTDTDPFPNVLPDQTWPNDSSIRFDIAKSFLPTGATLVNVCSYPSLGNTGNNNPFDCVVTPGGGFLKIVKVAPSGTQQVFNFTVSPGAISKSITGSGSTDGIPVPVGTAAYSVAETNPGTMWQLDSAVCALENSTPTGTRSGFTVSGITVESGKVTTCTFTNNLAGAAPDLAVTKSNDANQDGVFSDVETVPAAAVYPWTVTYEATIVNSSISAATISSIVDDKTTTLTTPVSGRTPTCASLIGGSIGANSTLSCYYDVTFANANTAQVINTVTVTATNNFGTDTASDTSTVNFTANRSLFLTKAALPLTYGAVGVVINYTYVARNDSNVTLNGPFTITDDKLGTVSCPAGALVPGASVTCTASHTITQADMDAGSIVNTAYATDGGSGTQSNNATATVTAVQAPHLTIDKSTTATSFSAVGQVIEYMMVATNDGNVTLTSVSIADPKLGTLTCTQPVTLAPGGTLTCTGTHTVTQADLDFGRFDNTATAVGTPPVGDPLSASDSVSVPAAQAPSLMLVKTAAEPNYAAVGDVINYTMVATNDGNVTLTNVSISDPKLGTLTCAQPVTLLPGETLTCTGTHTVTQADLDAGFYDNTATVNGTDPQGEPVSATDSESVPALQGPHLSLTKAADKAAFSTVGELITYTMIATNDGNVTLHDVDISDPLLGALTCTPAQPATLLPGETLTCTGTHTVTQADLNAGKVDNTAYASGKGPQDQPVSAEASKSVPAAQSPHLSLTKAADLEVYDHVGQLITYTMIATNDGNVTLYNVSISDPMFASLSCSPTQPATLAPGQSLTCTGTHTATQSDLDAGSIVNTANSAGTAPSGAPVQSLPASETVNAAQSPHIALVKTAAPTTYDSVGDVIHYTLVATNDGNVTLHDVNISDPLLGALTCTPALPAALAPNEAVTCTGTYVVTQADLAAGKVDNTATATGKGPQDQPVDDTDSATVTAAQAPNLALTKTAFPMSYDSVGDVIAYTLKATNTGNVTLHDVTINDSMFAPGDLTCTPSQPATLAPGQELICTASHTITQADLDAGSIHNAATSTYTPPSGPPITTPPSEVTVPAVQNPHVTLTKMPDPTTYNAVGQLITYTLVATNDGNVTLTNVNISDPLLGALTCNPALPATLAPGASVTCTGSHTITQADLDAGEVDNTATATGKGPQDQPVSDIAQATVTALQNPHMTFAKSAAPMEYSAVGQVINYTLVATNDGNVTLTNVSITDSMFPSLTCTPYQPATLAPGESLTCTATHTITQADLDAGHIYNVASATGTPPTGPPVTPPPDDVDVPAVQNPHITIAKTAAETNFSAVGNVIHYTMVATNDGNVTLHDVTITDPKLGALTCTQPATLLPGEALTCTGTHTVTQADLDAGFYDNTATTTGKGPQDQPVSDTDSATVPAAQAPHISLTKLADVATFAAVGDVINYTLEATNDGNLTLHDVTITDPKLGTLICTQPATLLPGEKLTCTGTHTVTQADLDAGFYDNTAAVSGKGPQDQPVSDEASESVPADQAPHLSLSKVATPKIYDHVGQLIEYTLVATNDGNVTLTNVSITDPMFPSLTCTPPQPATLAPGESLTCTASHAVTQLDLDTGYITNTANASGTDPGNQPVNALPASETVNAAQYPNITLDKSASPTTYDSVGDVIEYTFTATNDGNVTLHDVSITDPMFQSLNCTQASLAPGDTLTCTASHTVTQADLDAGHIYNAATAAGTGPAGQPVSDTDDADVSALQNPHMTFAKSAAPMEYSAVGQVINYTLVATNDGNVTLTNVSITDPMFPSLTCTPMQPATLAPGGTLTCTATHTITQADLDAGHIYNVASATGTPPTGPPVTPPPDDVDVPAVQNPHITLDKSASPTTYDSVGDVIQYTFTATNDGNVTLHDVSITDPMFPSLNCTQASLAPGNSLTCTVNYAVTQADLDAGHIYNTATAAGTGPAGQPVSDTDDATVTATQNAHLALTKVPDLTTYNAVGQVITYTLVATNDGNVTLYNVSISDPKLGALTCTQPVTLAPGGTLTCTGTHTVTQVDLDAGSYVNTASASGTGPQGQPASATATATVTAAQTPALTLTKSANPTIYSYEGQVIVYTYVVRNSGNVTLTGPFNITDNKLGSFQCSAVNTLAPNATISCTKSYTIQAADLNVPSITNTATATGKFGDQTVTSNQAQATINRVPPTGQIAPTQTTCEMFRDGTAANLDELLYNPKGNKINSVAPGVLFYYSKITAPSASFTIQVTQSQSLTPLWKWLGVQQLIIWDATCTRTNVTGTYNSATGAVTFNATGLTAGATYYISVKYDSSTLVGTPVPGNPSNVYLIKTSINGADVLSSWDGVTVRRK